MKKKTVTTRKTATAKKKQSVVAQETDQSKTKEACFIENVLIDLNLLCRGATGLTGMVVWSSTIIGGFVICGAISRVIEETNNKAKDLLGV